MPPPPRAERLVAAHSEVKRACDLLVAASPATWERCEKSLEQAVTELIVFRSEYREVPADAGARSAACRLRGDVLRAARLLQSLSDFYHGWERILGTMSAGYTASGGPAQVLRHGRIHCRG
jgi:hypothetical protein